MAQKRAKLGDSHNFGRTVTRRGRRIDKPRTVFWEWLVLARESPLRRALAAAATQDGLGAEAFEFLPTLDFFERSATAGQVEAVELEPLRSRSRETRRELSRIVGRALSLFSWLGVSDLHWENLVLGVDERERIIFGPLDVEMIFDDFRLPTETKLLPDADPEYAVVCQHAAGLRRVLPYLGKPLDPADLVEMLGAYRAALACLSRHGGRIGRALSRLPELRSAPIRVCLRGTEEYVSGAEIWPPLLEAEQEQLSRGDVPYFFRLYGGRGIHYFANRELTRAQRLPLTGDVPQLAPLLSVTRGLGSPNRQRLAKEGLFTLIGAFDHPELSGRHQVGGLALRFTARSLRLILENGEELRAGRDLSAFVSSVYMPCRCGEVRSVFVPEVTRCVAPLGGV